jgi:WD40 repeat protein
MKNVLFFLLVIFLVSCNTATPTITTTKSPFVPSQSPIPAETAQPTNTAKAPTTTPQSASKSPLNTVSPTIPSSPIPSPATPISYTSLKIISLTNIQHIKRIADFLLETEQRLTYPPYVNLSPDGQLLAYYDPSAHSIRLLDWKSQKEREKIVLEPGYLGSFPDHLAVVFNPSSNQVAIIREGPMVWEVPSGRLLLKSEVPIEDGVVKEEGQPYYQYFTDFLFSPDGSKILTGSWDAGSSLSVWNISTGKIVSSHPAHNNGIQQLVLSPDNRFVASADRGGHISFYDPFTGSEQNYPIESICSGSETGDCIQSPGWVCVYGIDSIAVTNNGKILAVTCDTNDLAVPECDTDTEPGGYCAPPTFYSTETWKKIGHLNSFRHKSGGITFNKDGGMLAFGIDQSGNRVEFWGTVSREKVHTIDGFTTGFRQVKFSNDGRMLLIQTQDGKVQIWGVE